MLGARFPGEPDNQPLKSVERSCAARVRAATPPAPPKPGETAAAAGGSQGAPAGSAADAQYQRRSEVDVELIEKYLEKRITREARNDFASAYKDAFGEGPV